MCLMLNLISNPEAQSMELKLCKAHLHHCYLFNEYSWALFKLKDGSLDLCICPSQQSVVFLMKAGKNMNRSFLSMNNSSFNDYRLIKSSGCLISGKQFV